jgi:DNA-binding NarL/FixJ family response regulator
MLRPEIVRESGNAPAAAIEHVGDPDRVFRILVADDHKLFRESLVSLLEQKPYLTIVGEAGDGQEAIDMARKLCPDIMIVDVTMPRLNGVQVTSTLSREFPRMKIIGLSMHESQDLASAMRNAGAMAYCVKNAPVESLINILRTAALATSVPPSAN